MAEEHIQRRLAAILAADVVGYSRMMSEDEAGTLARLKALRRELFEPKTKEYRGRIFKTTGDGALVEFRSAVDAVNCAVGIQQVLAGRRESDPESRRIQLRIGVSLGDVIVEGSDLYGNGVNVAARMEGLAEPGGICISGNVHEHVRGAGTLTFDDLGKQQVKNIPDPVRAFRVHLGSRGVAESDRQQRDASLSLPDKPSIAVLPFTNMSGDPEQEFFSDGITEDIITDLSKVSGVFVIARNSSFVYKGKAISVKEVGRELGVHYVLEGSVRRAGNRLRITGQLIDCGTDHHVWAERFDRNLDDIFAVQEEVARRVVKALEVTLLPAEDIHLKRVPTGDIDAYDEFLRGRTATHPPTKENLAEARRRFERAIELDPNFSGGYAGLAQVNSIELFFHYRPRTQEALQEALDLGTRAAAIDSSFGWAYSVLAWANFANGRHDAMVDAAFKAVEVQPGDAEAQAFLGLFLTFSGRPLEAIAYIETAIRLSPRFVGPYQLFFGYAKAIAGESEAALKAINDVASGAYSPVTFAHLILAYFEKGDLVKAKDVARYAMERYPNPKTFDWIMFGPKRVEDRERFTRALAESRSPMGDGRP